MSRIILLRPIFWIFILSCLAQFIRIGSGVTHNVLQQVVTSIERVQEQGEASPPPPLQSSSPLSSSASASSLATAFGSQTQTSASAQVSANQASSIACASASTTPQNTNFNPCLKVVENLNNISSLSSTGENKQQDYDYEDGVQSVDIAIGEILESIFATNTDLGESFQSLLQQIGENQASPPPFEAQAFLQTPPLTSPLVENPNQMPILTSPLVPMVVNPQPPSSLSPVMLPQVQPPPSPQMPNLNPSSPLSQSPGIQNFLPPSPQPDNLSSQSPLPLGPQSPSPMPPSPTIQNFLPLSPQPNNPLPPSPQPPSPQPPSPQPPSPQPPSPLPPSPQPPSPQPRSPQPPSPSPPSPPPFVICSPPADIQVNINSDDEFENTILWGTSATVSGTFGAWTVAQPTTIYEQGQVGAPDARGQFILLESNSLSTANLGNGVDIIYAEIFAWAPVATSFEVEFQSGGNSDVFNFVTSDGRGSWEQFIGISLLPDMTVTVSETGGNALYLTFVTVFFCAED